MTELAALRRAWRIMDRLDVEEDDRVRCDLICEAQDLADEWGGEVREHLLVYGLPVHPVPA